MDGHLPIIARFTKIKFKVWKYLTNPVQRFPSAALCEAPGGEVFRYGDTASFIRERCYARHLCLTTPCDRRQKLSCARLATVTGR